MKNNLINDFTQNGYRLKMTDFINNKPFYEAKNRGKKCP